MLSRSGPSPRLSIVIPAADAAALEDTLVSVLENRPADCEIIAALGMPYDDPWNIGEEVQFVQAPTGTGMVGRVNLGVAMSRGEVVHVLAAGWKATEGWADAALPHFDDPNVAAVAPVGVAADDRGRVVAAGVRRTAGGRGVSIRFGPRRWRRRRRPRSRPASGGSMFCPAAGSRRPVVTSWRRPIWRRYSAVPGSVSCFSRRVAWSGDNRRSGPRRSSRG